MPELFVESGRGIIFMRGKLRFLRHLFTGDGELKPSTLGGDAGNLTEREDWPSGSQPCDRMTNGN
jgi:hypothetical protein